MKKLIGLKKIRTAIFISGKGSNLKSLIKFSLTKKTKFKINLILSNNPNAKGLNLAKKFRINKKVYNFSSSKTAEDKILENLKKKKNKIDLSCGVYENFIQKFYKKIQRTNIKYSSIIATKI